MLVVSLTLYISICLVIYSRYGLCLLQKSKCEYILCLFIYLIWFFISALTNFSNCLYWKRTTNGFHTYMETNYTVSHQFEILQNYNWSKKCFYSTPLHYFSPFKMLVTSVPSYTSINSVTSDTIIIICVGPEGWGPNFSSSSFL